jgi:hypothetical protein
MMIPNSMRGATFDMFSTKVRFEAVILVYNQLFHDESPNVGSRTVWDIPTGP